MPPAPPDFTKEDFNKNIKANRTYLNDKMKRYADYIRENSQVCTKYQCNTH
jgi:hypothetical protein